MDDEMVTATRTRKEIAAYIDGVYHACRSLVRYMEQHPDNLHLAAVTHLKSMKLAVEVLEKVLAGGNIDDEIQKLERKLDATMN